MCAILDIIHRNNKYLGDNYTNLQGTSSRLPINFGDIDGYFVFKAWTKKYFGQRRRGDLEILIN